MNGMTLWNGALAREMDRIFPGFFDEGPRAPELPALNVGEDEKRYLVEVHVPGYRMEDLEVTIEDDLLTVRGSRKAEQEDQNVKWHRVERSLTGFTRTIRLPAEVEAGKIEASLEHGVLTLVVPKIEKAQPRRIELKRAK